MQDHPTDSREPEAFRFCFSAFLSAAISVEDALSFEGKKKFRAWEPIWKDQLTPEEKNWTSLRISCALRRSTRAASISSWIAFNELVGLQGQDRTYAAYTTPAQWGPTEESPKPVMVSRLTHYLEHEDGRAKVLALCRQYLGYLEKMVGDFLKAHS